MKHLWRLILLGTVAAAVLGFGVQVLLRQPETPLNIPEGLVQLDRLVIDKSDRVLVGFAGGQPVLEYKIALGFEPTGDKQQEGDGKTPEGVFRIDRRNPNSAFHLSLGIDYPQADDIARAEAAGVSPGGDIFIHGQPNAVGDLVTLPGDWTAGCMALTNTEMRILWELVPIGTPVEIRP